MGAGISADCTDGDSSFQCRPRLVAHRRVVQRRIVHRLVASCSGGDLGGVLPGFLTWAQTDFMVGLALGFPLARYLSGRIGDYRLLIGAFIVYSVASYLCGDSRTLAQFVPARIVQGIAGGITCRSPNPCCSTNIPNGSRPSR